MKKIIIAFLAGISYTSVHACDICGLGTSNYNPFLFPHLSKNYVNLSYLRQVYHIHTEEGLTKEYFNTVLAGAQFSISDKLQLRAMIPYEVNMQQSLPGNTRTKGIGDISLLANYRLWQHQGRSGTQVFVAGAGVKLPSGKYAAEKVSSIEDQNFQLGTGSTDYLLNGAYRLSYRKWVFSAVGSYKYNTQNKDNFRYGDVLTTGITAVYRKELREFSISPYIQVINETQYDNADNHVLQSHTGSSVFYTGGGCDVNTKKFAVGINYQVAASQNLYEGEINAKPRLSAHISIIL
jgi:hypothetical protein